MTNTELREAYLTPDRFLSARQAGQLLADAAEATQSALVAHYNATSQGLTFEAQAEYAKAAKDALMRVKDLTNVARSASSIDVAARDNIRTILLQIEAITSKCASITRDRFTRAAAKQAGLD